MSRMATRTARLSLAATDTVAAEVLALSGAYVRWAPESDREDCAQTAALFALDILNGEGADWTTVDAVRVGAERARRAYGADAQNTGNRTTVVDMEDPAMAPILEDDRTRIESWSPTAPDAVAQSTRADFLEDVFCAMEASAIALAATDWQAGEDAFRAVAMARAALPSLTGRPSKALSGDALADITDAAHAVLTRDAHRYGSAKHDGWDDHTRAVADTARHQSRTYGVAPFRRATFALGAYAHRQEGGALVAYVPSKAQGATDRQADAFAEATAPIGAVNTPSGVKRKRDGSVGASMVTGRKGWAERNVSTRS